MMKKKMKQVRGDKLFVVRKYIMASSASEAIRKERKISPDDVYVDSDWQKGQASNLATAIGFRTADD